MKNLFAVPFDSYQSTKTDQGIIYNVIDKEGSVYIQCWVAHRPYADHDLTIQAISGAPSSVRDKFTELMNEVFGVGQWIVQSRFSVESVRKSGALQTQKFIDDCQSISYSDRSKKANVQPAQIQVIGGLTY